MIRPFTIVTFLMATGSGLYLYQSKHDAQVLDRTIERIVHDTSLLREQSRLLAAEWTMLNDPERLRQFSDTYLSLKTIAPAQFTSLADLDGRLPAPRQEAPRPEPPVPTDQEPMAADPDSAPADPTVMASADDDLPLPPIPAAPPVLHRVVAIKQTTVIARPQETRVAELRPIELHPAAAPAPPLPVRTALPASPPPIRTAIAPFAPHYLPAFPPQAAPQVQPVPYSGGSLLGMARNAASPPPPLPTPVSVTNW